MLCFVVSYVLDSPLGVIPERERKKEKEVVSPC
jgi:hypothetical protein